MFIDETLIYVKAGRGGDGMMHFHREKYVARGGPDGGDGGKGGDVIFEVIPTLNTLASFRYQSKYTAENGAKGGTSNMTGRSGEDTVVKVPPGTIVYDQQNGEIVADLVQPYEKLVVAKGGKGGRGNPHFASARNQAPRMAEKGEPGEERFLRLELKLIADIGIVGVPNAGKSSLLAAVTNAKPKIANYPFTTLEPNLGVAVLDVDTSLILADIPGLIEGAHQGIGLGDAFLRHIQRTRVLIHLLDGMSEDPISDFTQINSEMALFDPMLAKKPQIVVFNKMDIPEVAERWETVQKDLKKHGYETMAISALTRMNVEPLLWKTAELLKTAPVPEVVEGMPVYRPMEERREFHVERVAGGWRVMGEVIERAAEMTYWELDGSVRRFQRLMEKLGVEDALREAGIQEGESVFIGENELEWED